jgi:hypothetical protein
MGRAELDRIFVRNYDLNKDLLGKITFAQMLYLMLEGRLPSAEQGRMIDAMLIVLVDHGMTTGAAAARMTFHSAPEAIQGAVAAAILGAGSVHLGSSEHCAKMLNDALPKDAKEPDLDALALKTVEKRLANNQLIPGIGHGIHTGGDPRAERLFEIAQETKVYGRYCELLKKIGKIARHRRRAIGHDHGDIASHHRLKTKRAAWRQNQLRVKVVLFKYASLLGDDQRRLIGARRGVGNVDLAQLSSGWCRQGQKQ